MSEQPKDNAASRAPGKVSLEGGTYEVIRNRLLDAGQALRRRIDSLNAKRKDVFGSIETALEGSERVTTDNNCVPRDMAPVGNKFIFGYNVFIGLRSETTLQDVFAVYEFKDRQFTAADLSLIAGDQFELDFQNLFKYYKASRFAKFAIRGPYLYIVFRVGPKVENVKVFKWLIQGDTLRYVDNRSEHEFKYPPQHQFEWTRTHRDLHHDGPHPHISIDDRVFVETIGGDLTVKIEDNTATGEGIYSEPVDNPDQTLDDAEIFYAIVGNLILLKVRPYQEDAFRYIVYSEKAQTARRIDAIADACQLLPDDHGIIFPKGIYLQTGEVKLFDLDIEQLVFEECAASPNGEDFLYVFYNRDSGTYVLLPYNLISQQVATPITCHGYSIFDSGEMILFRASDQPQKHHVVQIWQTPFMGPDQQVDIARDNFLAKIGNKDIVRCMAECHEVLTLLNKDDTYAGLYIDLVKKTTDLIDAYFWLEDPQADNLAEPLKVLRTAANQAVEEFDKVVRVRRATAAEFETVGKTVRNLVTEVHNARLDHIDTFVHNLTRLRTVRGEVIGLKSRRYVDVEKVDQLEGQITKTTDDLSGRCVEFLLRDESLAPYRQRVEQHAESIPDLSKGAEAEALEKEITESGQELEMLIDVVSNLKIDDATQTTAIIDRISTVYSKLNQVKSALKNRKKELMGTEAAAEFAAQVKLVDQSVVNYLDVSDTPEKCDEFLTKIMVQVETLESRFAEFDEFVVQIAEKREELYGAFESKKLQLNEARSRRASALQTAAERMLKGVGNRAAAFKDVNEINGFFAGDMMVQRVRDTIKQLRDLGDQVKADDIQSRLKTIREDAVRQLKDRQALYEDGDNVIRLGAHRFSVNRQPLELTVIQRDGGLVFHLAGTGFFETIDDPRLEATRGVWTQTTVSETDEVYRGEYLAWKFYQSMLDGVPMTPDEFGKLDDQAALQAVQQFMGPRYDEGYVKGVHDVDALIVLRALLKLEGSIGLLRYGTRARALGMVFWKQLDDGPAKTLLAAKVRGIGQLQELFETAEARSRYVDQLRQGLAAFVESTGVFEPELVEEAAQYLFDELAEGKEAFWISLTASDLLKHFNTHLKGARFGERLAAIRASLQDDPIGAYVMLRDWVSAYTSMHGKPEQAEYIDEVAALMFYGDGSPRSVIEAPVAMQLTGLVGSHPRIDKGTMTLNYCHFTARLTRYDNERVPRYREFVRLKKQLTVEFERELRLGEFKPRVLSSFVRNKLIDKVYLPIMGDNLAKQMGTVGETTRTDRMGLLLLISPPGYGKTTLMEYMANRMGVTFVKINGPAIGHRVTSLDPAEAPNAGAREEVEKLNLALEMGDNIMIYLDDIQHTHTELLQKFISLCDAQRRIEGVYKGRTRTYDLRGKKVAVVMAGNPYTESGEKFRLPDMLTNRADTYNLGDILGDHAREFVMSYLENSLTSNPVLNRLATSSQEDVYSVIKIAETDSNEGVEFQGNYSVEEINEFVDVMKKLIVVRDVVLKVNEQYIASAGTDDRYRTEPPFLLQGSYRNMNRIAEKVLPVMNDEEVWTVILSSYENDAQTLTTGAEANLLKFKELIGRITPEEQARWDQIKKTFKKNQMFHGMEGDDKLSMAVRQLAGFGEGLDQIGEVLARGIERLSTRKTDDSDGKLSMEVKVRLDQVMERIGQLKALADKPTAPPVPPEVIDRLAELSDRLKEMARPKKKDKDKPPQPAPLPPELAEKIDRMASEIEGLRKAESDQDQLLDEFQRSLVGMMEEQLETNETWLSPVKKAEDSIRYLDDLAERFDGLIRGYKHLQNVLKKKRKKLIDEKQREEPTP